ncbi:glycosyltransferase family 2 protein [Marinilactibacillus sp. Marseille-P9653]|uniref:glycosyltransferase family 2 protein n=1 Tax=Marinilactibacillus sp. Marseille-P9653 TaxID=2866583 RepID=UPI001CE47458|nr:glycosyltransferase family 2 protein [Marinilactibacillus sp. Marseille-P9653]
MDISIITPFYKGNDFIFLLTESIQKAIDQLKDKKLVEHIIVNDSPEYDVKLPEKLSYNLRVVNNNENQGIHQSRVNGLKHAKGEFIIFLDQDDTLTPNALKSQLYSIESSDICVGNGYFCFPNGDIKPIYKNKLMMRSLRREKPYIYVRDLIVSPGQVIIRKDSIPLAWKDNILKLNGTDDYLLWLLMLDERKKISFNEDYVYTHIDSGVNLSFNLKNMEKSMNELLSILKEVNYNSNKIKLLERRTSYKGKLLESTSKFSFDNVINLDIFLYNVYYRIFYGGNVISYKDMVKK